MTETKAISLADFISKHGINFECHRVDARPDGLRESSGDHNMRHFRCRIILPAKVTTYKGVPQRSLPARSFGLYFSQGSAHTSDPTLADVLNCLASDASGYENARTFEEWASEYGYDADSRKAEKTFRAIKRQAEQLKRTLGEEAYQDLLWHTEQR